MLPLLVHGSIQTIDAATSYARQLSMARMALNQESDRCAYVAIGQRGISATQSPSSTGSNNIYRAPALTGTSIALWKTIVK